ncbi:diox n domain-containing protein-related [Citrus sinensis]|uniref:Diox n domain-containing protein-related n=1 Tax=Citrus sinensis TaxID=2711 RepID=A0ACB8LUB7_CITSI|nr:diox n domain-containing protein-related [Citrus sinensis]
MTEALQLPVIDLSSPDRLSTAKSIRQACIDYGFFYLVNHGVEEELISQMFNESKKFFSLQLEDKMKLARKEHRGYTALCDEILDPSSTSEGDPKESFYIGPLEGTLSSMNQWPSLGDLRNSANLEIHNGVLPPKSPDKDTLTWSYMCCLRSAGRRLIHLIALALNLNEDFFEKVGALDAPMAFLRLLHYPGELVSSNQEVCGASAHSDYGMITLLATDGVPGLQARLALIVNIGDMMERWTNCLFRSTLHRVMSSGQERYSVIICFLSHLCFPHSNAFGYLPQSAAETTSKSESGLPMAHRSSTRDQSDCVEAAAVEDYSFK